MMDTSVLSFRNECQELERRRTADERPSRDPERVARNLARAFNPWRTFRRYSIVPNCIMERDDLSDGAKLVYARLMQFGGKGGDCHPSYERLAKAVGKKHRHTAMRAVEELENKDLLVVLSPEPGKRKSAGFVFVWQPWMDADEDRAEAVTGRKVATGEVARLGLVTGRKIATLKESSSEKTPRKELTYDLEFEKTWNAYPNRSGSNPKPRAYRAWLKQVSRVEISDRYKRIAEIHAGVERYRGVCDDTNTTGTQYVMLAARFFDEEQWCEPWDIPARKRWDDEPEVVPPPYLPKEPPEAEMHEKHTARHKEFMEQLNAADRTKLASYLRRQSEASMNGAASAAA